MNAHASTASGSPSVIETKAQKFTRLCEARASRVLDDIRLVTQLNTRAYDHTPAQAEVLVRTLADAVAELSRSYAVPFAFKVGRYGSVDPNLHIFEDRNKATTLAETNKAKLEIAKALDMIRHANNDDAIAVLIKLL